jgi:hypothetical protein
VVAHVDFRVKHARSNELLPTMRYNWVAQGGYTRASTVSTLLLQVQHRQVTYSKALNRIYQDKRHSILAQE